MHRTPLPENHCIRMENGGEYIIRRKIAEGGFSLVYEAETLGGTAPVVIKEYFPAEGAFRNNQNKVCPLVGYEERFLRNLEQFNNEGVTGGLVAQYSFQTVSFLSCGNGYALMQEESQDMVSVSDLVAGWSECPPIPYTGNLKDADPVFTDLTRLKYSLRVIESVLSVLSTIHERGYLHLDISSRNEMYSGQIQIPLLGELARPSLLITDVPLTYLMEFTNPIICCHTVLDLQHQRFRRDLISCLLQRTFILLECCCSFCVLAVLH